MRSTRTRSISRRRLLGGAVLLGAGATGLPALAACGENDNGGGGGEGGGQLRFAWWGNTDRDARTTRAVQAWSAASGRQVTLEPAPWEDYWTNMSTQFTGGNPPSLMQMDYQYIAQYAGEGQLRELDEYVPDPLALDGVPENAIQNGRIDGTLYGLTMGFNTFALMKNMRILEEAGVDDPDETLTWAQYADLCTEIAGAMPEGVFGTQNAMGAKEPMECWLHQRGKLLYTAEGQLGFAEEDLAEWFAYWVDLVDRGAAVDFETAAEALDDLSAWEVPSGRAAFNFHWSNIVPAFVEVSEDEIGVGMYPQGDTPGATPGQYYKASMLLSIPTDSNDPDAAADMIRALVLDPEIARELGFERGVPSSEQVRAALRPDASAEEQTSLEYVEFVADKIREVPPPPPQAGPQVEDEFQFYGEQVGFGEMSVDDAVSAFFESAAGILG
jgi:ABC-type glycerol-3-phosphate transport system substrate-binding protein